MKKRLLYLLFGLYLTSSYGQSPEFKQMLNDEYKHTVPVISPVDLYEKLLNGETLYLLDTRKSSEYEVSALEKAIHVGFMNFSVKKIKHIDKDEKIIVYCTVGVRSETVGAELIKKGFKDVNNLYGGIINWANHGYPVYSPIGNITKKVHVYSKDWGKWLTKGTAVY